MLRNQRELDESERAVFEAWQSADSRHRGAYFRAVAIHEALAQAAAQEALQLDLATPDSEQPGAERLESGLTETKPIDKHWKMPGWRQRWLVHGAAAAGIAILVALSFRPTPTDTVLQTVQGELRRMPLADHSVVSLNSKSKVKVEYSDTERQVQLNEGEAWFEVAKNKNKPFIVEAGDVRVRAVGTAFSVRRYENGAEVLVTEGKVEVWNADGIERKRLLVAGQQAFVSDQPTDINIIQQPLEVERKLAWRKGQLIFKNQTLRDAVADFNRYSMKKIVIVDPGLSDKTLVGHYQIDEPERFARDISLVLEVPISITTDKILIGKQGAGKGTTAAGI